MNTNNDDDPSESKMSVGRIARLTGQRIDKYRLVSKLGAGGMGSVYLAYDADPASVRRPVAIKLMHPHLAEEKKYVEMFVDEGDIAARLDHPFIVRVFDFGRQRDVYFMAMEYLVGEPLSSIMGILSDTQKSSVDMLFGNHASTAIRIVSDLCEGLHAAHELTSTDGKLMQVVHRDISPQNLFVLYDGTVRLIDFGVARKIGKIHESTTGVLRGKFSYMAPEQLHAGTVDRRTDVWALGVILWELLTRKRLFTGESHIETALAVDRQRVPLPSEEDPKLADLDPILFRAIERDPNRRYPTARAFGRDLLKYLYKQPEPVDHAEVAAWMTQLFPAGIARHRELMQQLGDETELPAILSSPPPAPSLPPPDVARFEAVTTETTTAVSVPRVFAAAPALPAMPEVPALTPPRVHAPAKGGPASPAGGLVATHAPRQRYVASSGRMNTAIDIREEEAASLPDSAEFHLQMPKREPAPARRRSSAGRNVVLAASAALAIAFGAKTILQESGESAPAARLGSDFSSLETAEQRPATPPIAAPSLVPAPPALGQLASTPNDPPTLASLSSSSTTAAPQGIAASESAVRQGAVAPVVSTAPRDTALTHNEAPRSPTNKPRSGAVPVANDPVYSAPAPSATTGTVRITSDTGQVDVFFDGQRMGKTPTTLTLPVGQQVLEVRPPGATPTKISVRVEPNKPVLLSVSPTM